MNLANTAFGKFLLSKPFEFVPGEMGKILSLSSVILVIITCVLLEIWVRKN